MLTPKKKKIVSTYEEWSFDLPMTARDMADAIHQANAKMKGEGIDCDDSYMIVSDGETLFIRFQEHRASYDP